MLTTLLVSFCHLPECYIDFHLISCGVFWSSKDDQISFILFIFKVDGFSWTRNKSSSKNGGRNIQGPFSKLHVSKVSLWIVSMMILNMTLLSHMNMTLAAFVLILTSYFVSGRFLSPVLFYRFLHKHHLQMWCIHVWLLYHAGIFHLYILKFATFIFS